MHTIGGNVVASGCDDCDLTDAQEAMGREITSLVSDKWASWILHELSQRGRLRFSRLKQSVEGISQKMLTKSLRQLERHGLVTRTMYMEVPPRVEYELSTLGVQFVTQISPFWRWIHATIPQFEAATESFDAKNGALSAAR